MLSGEKGRRRQVCSLLAVHAQKLHSVLVADVQETDSHLALREEKEAQASMV